MSIMIFGIYIIVGIILGAIFSLLFIQMDTRLKTIAISVTGLPSIFGALYPLNCYLKISANDELFYTCTFLYVAALLITIFIMIVITCVLIKHQTETVKIRILDILLGYNKCLEEYYFCRKKEVDNDLNYGRLTQLKDQIECEKSNTLEMKNKVKKQLEDAIVIKLPVNQKIPVDNNFLESMSEYAVSLSGFYNSLRNNLSMFLNSYDKGTDDVEFILAYLSSVCIDINTKLFNANNSRVRTHVRIKNGNVYTKLLAFIGTNNFEDDLTDMPINESLIKYAYDNRCSIVKSINSEYHHRGNNDTHWKNYISFAIAGICDYAGYPILSMGISISNEALYNDLLYFINMCQIEQMISECIAQINKVCNIIEVAERLQGETR